MNELTTDHYRALLGLDDNWRVTNVEFLPKAKLVDIRIEYCGSKLTCPECKTVDLLRYSAWMHVIRHTPKPTSDVDPYERMKEGSIKSGSRSAAENGSLSDDGHIYIGLAQCGITSGISPALESIIARKVAGTHSFEFAVDELNRQGIDMGVKAIKRVAYECGEGMLTLRKREIEQMRDGKIIPTGELAGCRVANQIDGGRMKLRSKPSQRKGSEFKIRQAVKDSESTSDLEHNANLPEDGGRSKARKQGRKTYQTDWREPKLVTIFVLDKYGKQVKKSKAWIDGTLQDSDALVVHKVLDCCHAIGQMHMGLKQFGLPEKMQKGLSRLHRKQIRDGEWRLVVGSLEKRLSRNAKLGDSAKQLITRSINYLRHHGEQGHLDYPKFAMMGLPLGSGAIESGIRRVINMRLKSNGMFWLAQHAEAILQLGLMEPSRFQSAIARTFPTCRALKTLSGLMGIPAILTRLGEFESSSSLTVTR